MQTSGTPQSLPKQPRRPAIVPAVASWLNLKLAGGPTEEVRNRFQKSSMCLKRAKNHKVDKTRWTVFHNQKKKPTAIRPREFLCSILSLRQMCFLFYCIPCPHKNIECNGTYIFKYLYQLMPHPLSLNLQPVRRTPFFQLDWFSVKMEWNPHPMLMTGH